VKRALTLLLSLTGAASAAPVGYAKVLDLISTAQTRVLLYAPQMTDAALADALRLKAIEGVPTYLVTVPYFSYQPGSTVNGLALAGARVFEANINSVEAVLIVDDKVFTGRTFGKTNASLQYLGNSPAVTNKQVKWFEAAARTARPLSAWNAAQRLWSLQK